MNAVLLADKTGEAAKAGPIGLVVIIVLCIACYYLFKSMSKHMKKVRDEWPGDVTPPDGPTRPVRPTRPTGPARPTAADASPTVKPEQDDTP